MSAISFLSFKLLILSWIITRRQLIHNRTVQRSTWNQSYDFIIVGAGTAGCVIANRLTENPNVTVLLLEAGGAQDAIFNDVFMGLSTIDANRPDLQWQYYGEPLPNFGQQYPDGRMNEFMGRALGGSSSDNSMVYNRGNSRDYDNWVKEYGAIGWSYKQVLPYFIKFENNTDSRIVWKNPKYHGVGGPVQISTPNEEPRLLRNFETVFNNMGFKSIDMNGPNQTGVMFMQLFQNTRGFRVSSASAYIDPNPHPNNLHIVSRALVFNLLFNGTTAVGVEFVRNDTSFRVYARKEVILSAGVYNTPQLLMLSGVGIKSHLQNFGIPLVMELPVGNNLMDHPTVQIISRITNTSLSVPSPNLSLEQLSNRFLSNSGPLGSLPVVDLYSRTTSQKNLDTPNILNAIFFADGMNIASNCILTLVRSRGTVRLQSSSPFISPRIDVNYLSDPRDFADLMEGLRFLFYVLETSPIAGSLTPPSFATSGCPVCPGKYNYQCSEGLECFIRNNTVASYHTGGTCRMGNTKRDDVVVDPLLRVKNMYNLRICDASIFPELPNSNTNAAVTMIGEKCAQIIKDCYYI